MTRRLLAGYLLLTGVVLVVLMVPLGIFYAQRERDRFTTDVERDATVLASIYEDALELNFPPDPDPAEQYRELTGARVVVVDRSGLSVVDSDADADRDFSTRPEIATALAGQRSNGVRRSETLNTDLLYVAVPVASGGVVHGAVRLTLDVHRIEMRIRQFWWGLATMAGVVVALATLIGFLLAHSFSRPIRQLNVAAARYASGDLSGGSPSTAGPREIRELSETMGEMAIRLDTMIKEQRSFVGDASHQLRTPLTALRLRLENLQSNLDEAQATELQSIIDESDRMAALVSDLLRLARAERHEKPVQVDLSMVTAERVDMWSAFAEEHGVHLELASLPESAIALVVPGAVDQVLDNLIDNAVRFAPAGSVVEVSVRAGVDGHRVSVVDHGPGLDQEGKDRATRRFWRGDSAASGTGLGLAIVDALVVASGGSLTLADTDPSGLTVIVDLVASGPRDAG
ncbi:MAG: HAMP domain-containing protein [Microthrixaceae bacterium]|nr:HAMP domain-containing protein [Microthrixaceae bacterium]